MGGHAKPHRSAQKSPVKTTANTANVKLAVDAKVARCEATCPAPPETAQDDAASKTPAATAALARKLKNLVAQDMQLWQLQLQEAHKRQRVLQQRRQQLQEQELAQAMQRCISSGVELSFADRSSSDGGRNSCRQSRLTPPMHQNCRRHWPQQWQTMAPLALGFPVRASAVL